MVRQFKMSALLSLPAQRGETSRKVKISAALREQVWIQRNGRVFETKCAVTWCHNTVSVFDFQCGHDIPESKGGPTNLENLYPICAKCNLSMSNNYTFKEWCVLYETNKPYVGRMIPRPKRTWSQFFSCFYRPPKSHVTKERNVHAGSRGAEGIQIPPLSTGV